MEYDCVFSLRRILHLSLSQGACGGEKRMCTRGWRWVMDSAMRVYAKLCQSIMKVAPCQAHASQHSGSVGMAGGTCTHTGQQTRQH